LGYTLHLPDEEDRFLKQKHELLAEIDVLLAGRAAEEVFLGEVSTGAGNDLDRATNILKDMITAYGMSESCQVLNGFPIQESSKRFHFLGWEGYGYLNGR